MEGAWELKLQYYNSTKLSMLCKVLCCALVFFLNRAHTILSKPTAFSQSEVFKLSYCFPVSLAGLLLLSGPLYQLFNARDNMTRLVALAHLWELWLVIVFLLYILQMTVESGYSSVSPFFSLLLAAHLPFVAYDSSLSVLYAVLTIFISWFSICIWRVDSLEALLILFLPDILFHCYGVAINVLFLLLLFLGHSVAKLSLK